MGIVERQEEIIRILMNCRSTTMAALAAELGVNIRTIRRDIESLSSRDGYPIYAMTGKGGGVGLADYKHPRKNIFSRRENEVLFNLLNRVNDTEAAVIRGMLAAYGNIKVCETQAV